ncbi:MAG TPA: L,D-transpeptidase [Acidimicrobiales bacterium]|nr:L,D-transpeptidase [Acidimicrobiales bacterium]
MWSVRRVKAATAAAVFVVAGLIGWQVIDSPRARTTTVRAQAPATTVAAPVTAPPTVPPTEPPTTVPPPPPPSTHAPAPGSRLRLGVARPVGSPAQVADAIVSRLGLYSQPGQAEPDDFLQNPTWEGLKVVGLVMQRQGDWIEMQISRRPNMATAWVKASEVRLRTTPYRIRVDSSSHRLTAYNGGQVVLQASVAVGTGGTPTPTGSFFVDGIVTGLDPTGAYGPAQISVAGFSNVYQRFAGGVGQIAIHGTNAPGSVGRSASNGCVRMTNDDILKLVDVVPTGTPVEIYP